MGGLFNPDNALFRGMSKVWDMLVASILWTICCIPGYFLLTLVTSQITDLMQLLLYMAIDAVCMIPIGPATASLYYVCMKVIRRDRGYVFREYFHAFRMNFKVGALSGAILGALVTLLSFNLQFSYAAAAASDDIKNSAMLAVTLAICLILLGTSLLLFPVLSRFTMSVRQLFKSSLYMAFRHILHTLAVFVIVALSGIVMYILIPAVFFMPAVCALLCSFPIERVLKRYMPKPEKTAPADGTLITEGDVVSEGEDGERRDLWYWE